MGQGGRGRGLVIIVGLLFWGFRTESSIQAALPIFQGYPDETSTPLVVTFPKDFHFEAFLYRENDPSEPLTAMDSMSETTFVQPRSRWAVRHYHIDELEKNTRYRFELRTRDGRVIDRRWFKTIDPQKSSARIALISCIHDLFYRPKLWQNLFDQKPDAIISTGDNVYVDDPLEFLLPKPNADDIWRRNVEVRNTLPLFFQTELIPYLATWDDHDVGFNGADGSFQELQEARRIFKIFFSPDRIHRNTHRGPGLAAHYSLFGIDLFLLDGRSFRSHRNRSDPSQMARVLGTDQMEWLWREINSKNVSWIMKGDQFFGGYRKGDSSEYRAPQELRDFMNGLRKHSSGRVFFASGDRHYSEIMKLEPDLLGHESLEITSSSMHSLNFRLPKRNSRRLAATRRHNFVIVDFVPLSASTPATSLPLRITSWGDGKTPLFQLNHELFFVKDASIVPTPCTQQIAQLNLDQR